MWQPNNNNLPSWHQVGDRFTNIPSTAARSGDPNTGVYTSVFYKDEFSPLHDSLPNFDSGEFAGFGWISDIEISLPPLPNVKSFRQYWFFDIPNATFGGLDFKNVPLCEELYNEFIRRNNGKKPTSYEEFKGWIINFEFNAVIQNLSSFSSSELRLWFLRFYYRDHGECPKTARDFGLWLLHASYFTPNMFIPDGVTQQEWEEFKKHCSMSRADVYKMSLQDMVQFQKDCPDAFRSFHGFDWPFFLGELSDPLHFRRWIESLTGVGGKCDPANLDEYNPEECGKSVDDTWQTLKWIAIGGLILIGIGTTGYAVHEVRLATQSRDNS